MNWYRVFYWMTVADGVSTILSVIAIITCIATGLAAIGVFYSSNELSGRVVAGGEDQQNTGWKEWNVWYKSWKRIFSIGIFVCVISSIAWSLIPSKKQMMVIIAGGAIGNFVSTDSSSKAIPAELTKYVRNYLKKNAEDLDFETKKELGVETPKETLLNKIKTLSKEEAIEYLKNDTTILK